MAHNIISTGLNTGNTIFNSNGGILISGDAVKGGYFVTDTVMNIPSWANTQGTLCYCTTDSKFYQYNGASWAEKVFGITANASSSAAGLMSPADKQKLDGIDPELISYGTTDPNSSTTSQFYFKYSAD